MISPEAVLKDKRLLAEIEVSLLSGDSRHCFSEVKYLYYEMFDDGYVIGYYAFRAFTLDGSVDRLGVVKLTSLKPVEDLEGCYSISIDDKPDLDDDYALRSVAVLAELETSDGRRTRVFSASGLGCMSVVVTSPDKVLPLRDVIDSYLKDVPIHDDESLRSEKNRFDHIIEVLGDAEIYE